MSAESGQAFHTDTFRAGALPSGGDAAADSCEQIVFTHDDTVTPAVFDAAWQQLVARHSILRTAFHPQQASRAAAECPVRIAHYDWRALAPEERERRFPELLREQRDAPFDPAAPPLFRVVRVQWQGNTARVAWTLRRSLLDGRSLSILLRELFAHMRAALAGSGAAPKAALVSAEPGWPDGAVTPADDVFWKEFLAGVEGPTEIDLPVPGNDEVPQAADDVVITERCLDAARSEGVRRLHKAADVTMNNLVQAAWSLLLSHYARSEDVLFGLLRSCRRSGAPGMEDAVGPFVNIVPLRVTFTPTMNVFELLWQLRDRHRDVRAHECDSLAGIEACSGIGAPMFDSVIEFDERNPMIALGEMLAEEGAREFQHRSGPLARFHLQVYAEERIVLRLKHARRALAPEVAARMLEHLAKLLTALAQEPWMPVRDIPYLRDDDRTPVCWPGPPRQQDAALAPTLHGRFEQVAAERAQAIALACGERSIRYGELNEAANRLAHRLRALGARPDMLVGLCTERSIEQVIGILGILKSGAAYLPLDPAYPAARLSFLLEDANVNLIVAGSDTRDVLPAGERTLVDPVAGAGDTANPDELNGAGDLAYVIYTSGSTGQPKGVMVTHYNVLRLFESCQGWLQANADDTWSLFHSFAFDFSVWEIWGALLYGGRVEIVPRDFARSPEAFLELLAARGVTVLSQTPSAFLRLMQADEEHPRPLAKLRMVVFGGEKLDPAALAGWIERHGDEHPQLINMYGITETTVHVTYRRLRRRDLKPANASLIGWPLADLYVRLLDGKGRPVPPGVRGEICVGGDGVTRGYLNRPELDAARFVNDPHSADPQARLYRSGDFARQMQNGELCYLGREDDEVKIRGFRVDLGEIANILKSLPGVEQAVVVPRAGADGERRLFAYYVASAHTSAVQLREQLAQRLPDHMLPAMLVPLDAIPVNANSKIDYRALPDPAKVTIATAPPADPPRSGTEQLLCRLWSEVLERGDIGRGDDFFGLGGDSVLALKLVARARAAGLDMAPRDVFNHAVLKDLARHADAVSISGKEPALNAEGPWPLTPIQRWFFDQQFNDPDHWNEARLFRIPPDTDVDLLERALLAVVHHHEALRVRFTRTETGPNAGRWAARPVRAAEALEFSRIELDHLGEDERRHAREQIINDIQASLSITSGRLVRAAHFAGGTEGGARLLIVIHKLAVDAASWTIILQDLDSAWRALADGRQPQLPAAGTSVAQWAGELERKAHTAITSGEHAYWEQVMRANAASPLADARREPGIEADTLTVETMLDAPDTAALMGNIHHAYGTELRELLIASLAQACAQQWPEHPQLRIDLERQERPRALSRTVGWLATLQPLALALAQPQAGNIPRMILAVKNQVRGAPQDGMGWGLLRYLRPSGRAGFGSAASNRAPILLEYPGRSGCSLGRGIFQHASEDTGAPRGASNARTHPLAITAMLRDDRMAFRFRFSPGAIPISDVEALAGKFVNALRQVIRHCRTREDIVRTPLDFPLAHLSQHELDHFPVPLASVDDILPLAPIQRLHHALSGTSRDVGFDQWVFRLRGDIDETAFEAGWRELFRRHDALRTVFVDEGLVHPRQVVLRDVDFRLQRSDWRLLDDAAREQRLAEFLAADRRQGFDTCSAPLMRATLIRTAVDRWILAWSHHQALVDGWSWPILARELGALHDARRANRGAQLEPPGSYRSYITWLTERDTGEYAAFWREHLGEAVAARTLITSSRRVGDNARPRELRSVTATLPGDVGAGINRLARRLRITPSVVFQAAWALLLCALTRRFDVIIGVAFSGRTAGVPAAMNTVGPFLNDLPVRLRVNPAARTETWLAELRAMQADLNHYQNVSPLEVNEWAGVPAGVRLFDSLLVMQNHATGDATQRWGEHIAVEGFDADVLTNYPLNVAITPGESWRIDLFHDEAAVRGDEAAAFMQDFTFILTTLAKTPDVQVATIMNRMMASEPRAEANVATNESRSRRAGDGELIAVPGATAPASLMEARIAHVCAAVLGVEEFGRDSNFFDAGAQSLSLLEIHAQLQRELGFAFPIVTLFQQPTVAALARHFAARDDSADNHALRAAAARGAVRRAALVQRRRQASQPEKFDE